LRLDQCREASGVDFPPHGKFVNNSLNHLETPGKMGGGGLILGHRGEWLMGVTTSFGIWSAFKGQSITICTFKRDKTNQ